MLFKKMNDIINIPADDGIFHALFTLNKFSWLDESLADLLDLDYYLNHSGNKYISNFVDVLYKKDAATYLSTLANIIYTRFGNNWNKLYDAYLVKTYNPIENYSMVEEENAATNITNKTDGNNNVFGFNTSSDDGVKNNLNHLENNTTGDFDKNHRKLTRSGNIGVTTSQQMLESELNLRRWDFYNHIMNDIDTIYCLMVR